MALIRHSFESPYHHVMQLAGIAIQYQRRRYFRRAKSIYFDSNHVIRYKQGTPDIFK
jgi:hypothetical protein